MTLKPRIPGFEARCCGLYLLYPYIVIPKKLETGLRPNSAGIPFTSLLRIEAIGFPTFGLLLYLCQQGDSVTPQPSAWMPQRIWASVRS